MKSQKTICLVFVICLLISVYSVADGESSGPSRLSGIYTLDKKSSALCFTYSSRPRRNQRTGPQDFLPQDELVVVHGTDTDLVIEGGFQNPQQIDEFLNAGARLNGNGIINHGFFGINKPPQSYPGSDFFSNHDLVKVSWNGKTLRDRYRRFEGPLYTAMTYKLIDKGQGRLKFVGYVDSSLNIVNWPDQHCYLTKR